MDTPFPNTTCSPDEIRSWIDYQKSCPLDPREIIAYADIGGSTKVGSFDFSDNYIAPGTWSTNVLTISDAPVVSALETDNELKVAEAKQWNFEHLTWNDSSALAIPARKIVFLRGGTEWINAITLNFGGGTVTDLQISLMMNAATRGDKQGNVPVINWSTMSLTGEYDLNVVLKQFGMFSIGIWTYDGANYAMYEMVWNVVP